MRVALVALLLLCVERSAHAEDRDVARQLAAQAQHHFDLGEYREAAADFRNAYRRAPRPALLYNLGQSYRLAGDCTRATTMYRNFVRVAPPSPYRTQAQEHLAALDCPEATPRHVRRARTKRNLGIGIGAAGVVLAAVGIRMHTDGLVYAGAAATGAGTALVLSWRF